MMGKIKMVVGTPGVNLYSSVEVAKFANDLPRSLDGSATRGSFKQVCGSG
jgi:hypothetical protein